MGWKYDESKRCPSPAPRRADRSGPNVDWKAEGERILAEATTAADREGLQGADRRLFMRRLVGEAFNRIPLKNRGEQARSALRLRELLAQITED